MNIFNIPSNYNFFLSLLSFLDEKFDDLAKVKIFLPNRRSCRELTKLILEKDKEQILPKIQAISDISYEDFFDLNLDKYDEINQIIEDLLKNKVLPKDDYLFFLSKEIQNLSVFGDDLEFEQAFKIAIHLKNLFTELDSEEIGSELIDEIDDSNLSLHRQFTLEFLKSFYCKIQNSLLKNNILSIEASHNLIIEKYSQILNKNQLSKNFVIAGSTGSLPHSRKLIKSILNQKNSHVILYGLNDEEEIFYDENHSKFFLNNLISYLEIEKSKIINLKKDEFLISISDRQKMISTMMLPAFKTLEWQNIENIKNKKLQEDLNENFKLIEAKDEIEEAKIISLVLQENFGKKIGIISNNDKLISLLKVDLNNRNISFNDSRNLGVFNSRLIDFLLLILELRSEEFNSSSFLSILKGPFCLNNYEKKLITDFEIKILRNQRKDAKLSGIKLKLKEIDDKNLSEFFDNFYKKLFQEDNCTTLCDHVKNLIKIAENLSGKSFEELLKGENSQIELFEFFEKLKLQNDIKIKKNNILSTFKTLLSQVSYFEKSKASCKIDILSTIEARLLNFDLLIISSLNEGDFPQIDSDNWLGRKIKKDLKIDKSLKKIGQNAYDFCNYLSNKSVILTRSKSSNGNILSPCPFLLKLQIFCKKLNINLKSEEKYFSHLKYFKQDKIEKITNPKPAIEFRPKRFSITDISKLISDPYFIYSKKILNLKELKKIDFEASYAEFGSFVHKSLEEFVKEESMDDFLPKAKKIFKEYFINNSLELIWWPKFENIFNNFILDNKKFNNAKNHLELAIEFKFEDILIRGKIDRLICENGEISIFDYKTGQAPSEKDVFLGKDVQLPLYLLAILQDDIAKTLNYKKLGSLNYWKLSALSKSEIKKIVKDEKKLKALIMATKINLKNLFEHFKKQENGYILAPNRENYKKNEYWHLSRIN